MAYPATGRPGALAIVLLVLVVFPAAVCVGSSIAGLDRSSRAAPAPPAYAVQGGTDEASQIDRFRLIEELRERRVIHRLDANRDVPRLYVGPAFYALALEEKQSTASLVLAYCVVDDPRRRRVSLRDWRTGKEVGTVSTTAGLRLE